MNDNILNKCKGMTADEIFAYLHSREMTSCLWKENIALADAASLFTALVFLAADETDDKEQLRKSAYLAFLGDDKKTFPQPWSYLAMLAGGKETAGIRMRILKGGSFKIKQYYLENSKLNDIRGASTLLTQVEETTIPQKIAARFIRECIIYCGGGNILAVLPERCEDEFPILLESEAKSLLISAGIAYCLGSPVDAAELFGPAYHTKMTQMENALGERKKLIISNNIYTKTTWNGNSFTLDSEQGEIDVPVHAEEADFEQPCVACGKRHAFYRYENELLCASCLHKKTVGKKVKHSKYLSEYRDYTKKTPEDVQCLADIDREYIAVVYGDGNNMGGIIQNFQKITDMMAFSRDVKAIAHKAVFEAMGETGITRFEVVGLGGDDVFVIVPGKQAYHFSALLIEKYNRQFIGKYGDQVSTMSVGIAIGKTTMPIIILLKTAEARMQAAKALSRQNKARNQDDGSLAFSILDTFEGERSSDRKKSVCDTMQPYSLKIAKSVLKMVQEIKKSDGNAGKTKLRNILAGFTNAESVEEAALFFRYLNAKVKDPSEAVHLNPIDGYQASDGYYEKDGTRFFIWKDLMDLLDYCE